MIMHPDSGRVGDIWKAHGTDREMVVEKANRREVAVNSLTDPQEFGWAFPHRDWNHTIYRFREDPTGLTAGDHVHLYVPEILVYLVRVLPDHTRPALTSWLAFRTGEFPPPEIVEDPGIHLQPVNGDETIQWELIHRPFSMLAGDATITDANNQRWSFQPPFIFIAEDGHHGIPQWPLQVVDDPHASQLVNRTTSTAEIETWTQLAQVEHAVFDLKYQGWDS